MAEWFSSFQNDIYRNFIVEDRWQLLVDGWVVSLQVSFMGLVLGVVLGIIIAAMRMTTVNFFGKYLGLKFIDTIINRLIRMVSYIYLDVVRGTPAVTQILIWHFVVFAGTNVPVIIGASIAIGVNSGAYVAEIIRAGILSVEKGQAEAGRTLGLSSFTTMRTIVMPQAVKNILPTLCNEFIILIKETAIMGFVALTDLNRAARQIFSVTFDFWLPLFAAAIMYYLTIKTLTIFLRMLERRLRRADAR